MKAAYPLSGRAVKRNLPVHWHYGEKKKYYYIDGAKFNPEDCARYILELNTRSIIFFPGLKQSVGNLIGPLLSLGSEINCAGAEVRSLNILYNGKTIYLADASLYFPENTSREKISELVEALFPFGIRLAPTPGSTAIRCLRRLIPSGSALWQRGELFNQLSRGFLTGGALHWRTGVYPDAFKYDLKAAYAWALKDIRLPLRVRIHPKLPESEGQFSAIVNINYSCPNSFSPLVARGSDGLTYHPTQAKNLTVALTGTDFNTLARHGKLTINKIKTVFFWNEGDYIFAPFIEKMEALEKSNPNISQAIKIIRNAVYGKLAESDLMTVSKIIPYRPGMGNKYNIQDIIESDDQLYAIVSEQKENFAPYHNPFLASLIPAKIRARVYDNINSETVYVDTDGFISETMRADIIPGSEYGDWTLEDRGDCAIVGPRAYLMGKEIKLSGQHLKIKPEIFRSALVAPVKIQEAIYPNPLTLENIRHGNRTIRAIKYPRVTAEGSSLFVTRSPMREIPYISPDFI